MIEREETSRGERHVYRISDSSHLRACLTHSKALCAETDSALAAKVVVFSGCISDDDTICETSWKLVASLRHPHTNLNLEAPGFLYVVLYYVTIDLSEELEVQSTRTFEEEFQAENRTPTTHWEREE